MQRVRLSILILSFLTAVAAFSGDFLNNWPNWRGPLSTGEAPAGDPPIEWSETQNVKWKIVIPGKGLSTPVIWNDMLFITTAVELDSQATADKIKTLKKTHPLWMKMAHVSHTTDYIQQFMLIAVDRKTGKTVWQKILIEDFPHEGTHRDGSWAAPSCVTDGEVVIASFGSFGFYCLDLQGNLIWQKDLGDMNIRNAFGEGSSPALYENSVVINWDHEGNSFMTVLNKKTGDDFWKMDRDEPTSWSTPLVLKVNEKPQIIIPATNNSMGYDLKTGEVLWKISGMTLNVIPSPVYANGMVYLMSGFRGSALQAIRLENADGPLEGTNALLWTYNQDTPYTPSPLLYQHRLYFTKGNKSELTCLNAKTGAVLYSGQKLDNLKDMFASPVAANGKVYFCSRNGVTLVIRSGDAFEVLSVNTLNDSFDASPAIAENAIYLRGLQHLYCISN